MSEPGTPPTEGGATATDIGALSFESAFRALEEAIARLEAGELSLEEALDVYERGVALAARCDGLLTAAELRIRQVDAEGREVGDLTPS